ncbi:MAG: hypothetical protein LC737_00105 [Chloroflexi bacterium]|nr:hypothetical protein [Chloroflexota bacterium]
MQLRLATRVLTSSVSACPCGPRSRKVHLISGIQPRFHDAQYLHAVLTAFNNERDLTVILLLLVFMKGFKFIDKQF